ncbi:MAG: hypothetical protein QXU32_00105 [Nitrososphaerales archaeon]
MASRRKEAHYTLLNGKYLTDTEDLLRRLCADIGKAGVQLYRLSELQMLKEVQRSRRKSLTKFVAALEEENRKFNLATEFSIVNLYTNFHEYLDTCIDCH